MNLACSVIQLICVQRKTQYECSVQTVDIYLKCTTYSKYGNILIQYFILIYSYGKYNNNKTII